MITSLNIIIRINYLKNNSSIKSNPELNPENLLRDRNAENSFYLILERWFTHFFLLFFPLENKLYFFFHSHRDKNEKENSFIALL